MFSRSGWVGFFSHTRPSGTLSQVTGLDELYATTAGELGASCASMTDRRQPVLACGALHAAAVDLKTALAGCVGCDLF